MVCSKTLNRLVIYYRIFKDYFGVPIDDVNSLRRLIHSLNLLYLESYCVLCIYEHPIMIDERVFENVNLEYSKNSITLGKMPLEENEDCDWTIWEETSRADRGNFIKLMSDTKWLDSDVSEILIFDYESHIEENSLPFYEESYENHFLFEWEFKGVSYFDYKTELESRKKIESRNQLLNKLL